MKYLLLGVVCLVSVFAVAASGTIHYKTTINQKLLPPLFPSDAAVAWTNLYFDSSRSLLAFNCKGTNSKKIEPDQTDFFTLRTQLNNGQVAKWIKGNWISTSKEYEYHLQKVEFARTKRICGYVCYAVTFSDKENSITSTGWITNALPVHQGIRLVQGSKGALLAYENEKEATFATAIDATVPANWIAIYQQVRTAIVGQPLRHIIPATGETKPIIVGQSFPRFYMTDINGKTWENRKLAGRTTILVVWGDLDAVMFPDGTFSESDFQFLQRLEESLQKKSNKIQVMAPTFTGRTELLQKYPASKKFKLVCLIPDAENWMSNQVKIKRFPTIVLINRMGVVVQRFEFSHGQEEYRKLEQLIRSL